MFSQQCRHSPLRWMQDSPTHLCPMGDHTDLLQIPDTPLIWPPLMDLLHLLNHLYYLRDILPRNHGDIPFSHTRDVAKHKGINFRMGWDVPTGSDGVAIADVEVLGDELNNAGSGTIILIEDDPALHGHLVPLPLVELKEPIQEGVISRLPTTNREELWGYLHVVPSQDNAGLKGGVGERNQSFTLQHLRGLVDHDVGEVAWGDLQVLGQHGGGDDDVVLVDLSLRGLAEGALVWCQAAVHLRDGVRHVDGPVGVVDPQGNSPRVPRGHIAVKILPDVNVSSARREGKGKVSRNCWCCS